MTQATSAPIERKVPNYELLKDAYQIIDGIPALRFNLESIYRTEVEKGGKPVPVCDTIACAAGWLALHPKFQAAGLRRSSTGRDIQSSRSPVKFHYAEVMAEIFDISADDARNLFAPRGISKYDSGLPRYRVSDKELWKARVIAFLTEHNALTPKVPA